jgi:dihydrodipicolinate synthase/N-acetylneuraminate lyase
MEFDEFQAVVLATVEECKRYDMPVMIGVTSTYTLGAQRRAEYAAKLGADAIQLALPYWLPVEDCDVVPFMSAVASSCPDLAVSLYETIRCKKALTIDQHRALHQAVPAYLAVKSQAGTVGCTEEGCSNLSEFVNVWVGERDWSRLGPHGANGTASSLVYMNPPVILHMFELLCQKQWDQLKKWTDRIEIHDSQGLAPFEAKDFTDTAYDHLQGAVAGFLKMHPRSRGPYISATEADVAQLRSWMQQNLPQLLDLECV